jgi:hypothetical protein
VIDVLSMMQLILRDAGFNTSSLTIERSPGVLFEDDAVVGFGYVFQNSYDLLSKWKGIESAFLLRHSHSLRQAGEKAWNVYAVLLSQKAAEPSVERQVRWIEEDLDRTRKITASGIETREDLITALLPLLPIQYRPSLGKENVGERLKHRISLIAPHVAEVALDTKVPPEEVVRLMGELK